MIYSTFKNVKSDYEYAWKLMHGVSERAEAYIKDVLHEVGTLEVTVDNTPTVITLKGKRFEEDEHIVFYQGKVMPKMLYDFPVQDLIEICREIHSMHLVEEYDDDVTKESA